MRIQTNFLIAPRTSYVRPPENFKATLPFGTAHPVPLGRYSQNNAPEEVAPKFPLISSMTKSVLYSDKCSYHNKSSSRQLPRHHVKEVQTSMSCQLSRRSVLTVGPHIPLTPAYWEYDNVFFFSCLKSVRQP